ncbi:MAG: RHS repeat-associated core domain-containing protein [Planctomycetota bacterium]|jgi:hypothetical protein
MNKGKTSLPGIVIVLALAFAAFAQPAVGLYMPSIGRFSRMDPFTGEKEQPQSLHKYAYVHNDPVNKVDPSGKFGLPALSYDTYQRTELRVHYHHAQAPTIKWITAVAMILAVGGSQIMSPGLDPAEQQAAEEVDFLTAQRIVQTFAMQHVNSLTQEDFHALENRLRPFRKRRNRNEVPVYLHYGFSDTASIFRQGLGLKAPSWCTKTVYATGWDAKYHLAQFNGPPRNALYVVLPHGNTKIYGPDHVSGAWDRYMTGIWLPGGGTQWYFPNGTGPGTVFGPVPIAEGTPGGVR